MADVRALRSYLVSLGFSVNTSQAAQFNNAIKTAAQVVNTNTTNIVGNMAKWGIATVGLFEAVGMAVGAMMEKVAKADQQYRLFGERMFMDTKHAKSLQITLKELGVSLEQAAFDPEINRRVKELNLLQQQRLMPMLGSDFPRTMVQLRDAMMEMSKFRVEALYFRDLLVKQIFQALGGEKLTEKLRSWNEYIMQHMPEWSRIITTYIVPVLKDAWMILTDIWNVAVSFAQLFTNIIGMISGDPALEGTISFEKFAAALEKVAHWLAIIIHFASKFAGTIGGAVIGFSIGGPAGAAIGAAAGGLVDAARSMVGTSNGNVDQGTATTPTASGSQDVKQLASQVGGRLGVDPSIIYSQWAHETGNFTNRGAQSLNNLAGIRMPGSTEYRHFGSLGEFGNYYANLIQRRYPGAVGAQSVDQYATALKAGGYFEDSLSNYERGMRSFAGAYGRGSNVQIGSINIMQPNASAEQIAKHVGDEIAKRQNTITSAQLAELRSAY
jgi:hypothetical protein